MRSVVVAKYIPWPPNSGDKRRTLGVVQALRELGEVTVCAFSGPDEDPEPLLAQGIGVRSVPRAGAAVDLLAGLLRGRSLTAARFWSPALARIVGEEAGSETDLLVIEHVQLLGYSRGVRARRLVVDMHNIESSLTARYAASRPGLTGRLLRLEARALTSLERRANRADAVAVVSRTDAAKLTEVAGGSGPAQVLVVPNAWDTPTPLPPNRDATVCFVALMSWAPNVDAAVWFTRHVWPKVLAAVPAARLLLVGRNPAPAVRALAGPSVEVTGTVVDTATEYARSRVAVAPLRSGGGSRLKILEALAFGRPVVATTVGAEGLEDLVGRGVVVADRPADVAARIVELLGDYRMCDQLAEMGAAAVGDDHSWRAATQPLVDFALNGSTQLATPVAAEMDQVAS